MSDSTEIEYNLDFTDLENLLAEVDRPGSYCMQGRMELPMPRIEVQNVGQLSFPLLEVQVKQLIEEAERAPYGRGKDTILDTSVRKVWQIEAKQVSISSNAWQSSFDNVLEEVKKGLGCSDYAIKAELYKLLIYDEGGFFLSHRDSEKDQGMFGTLVVALPSNHSGGELIVRHAGHEASLSLRCLEPSEISYAAFYADCEHEVKPITSGNRICLVFNLIQQASPKDSGKLHPPMYDDIIEEAASCLIEGLQGEENAIKVAWLLEHQYTPKGLSFAALKNGDAAIAKVLCAAAKQANCSIHLGIVHIEESGSAEPSYDRYYPRKSRRHYYDEGDECEVDDDFEVVEVCESYQHIDNWIDNRDSPIALGSIPLEPCELLPVGALDHEPPDEKRLLEASGNAGVSFERAYHRAAIVLWHKDRYGEVLLQGGISAAQHFLEEQIVELRNHQDDDAQRQKCLTLAGQMIEWWEKSDRKENKKFLSLLLELGELKLLEEFTEDICTSFYDGNEDEQLIEAMRRLDISKANEIFSRLISTYFHDRPNAIAGLILQAVHTPLCDRRIVKNALEQAVNTFEMLGQRNNRFFSNGSQSLSSEGLISMWEALMTIDTPSLLIKASEKIAALTSFDEREIIVPALKQLHERYGKSLESCLAYSKLWQNTCQALLAKSEYPPAAPKDWKQDVTWCCDCLDCKSLKEFVAHPQETVHRFPVAQDRRSHLQGIIRNHKLDIDFTTEEKGRPYTLVCKKNRASYILRCQQHQLDVAAMQKLYPLLINKKGDVVLVQNRLSEAIERLTFKI